MRLKDKVAIITGSSSGIGRAIAYLYAQEGAKVVVSANLNIAGGEETVSNIKAKGGEAIFVKSDVTVAEDVKKLIQETVAKYGTIDILVNNVGGSLGMAPFENIDEAKFDRIVAVNLKSVYLMASNALPELKKAEGGGVIINIGSMSALRPAPGVTLYAALKGAVIILTKTLAQELAPYKIRVNVVNPTMTATERALKNPPELLKQFEEKIPLKRLASPEDVANAALFLASDESSYLTGDAINVDGGDGI
jgi:3-oxoacyl-[acyl-carrier protein] reductase